MVERMPLKAEAVVYPGRSLGRAPSGIAVFTDGLLPGETGDVTVLKRRSGYWEARLEKITAPSPDRIVPRCPSFGWCGGCTFQHTTYENQLAIKSGYVSELMRDTGRAIEPIVPAPAPWGYRNKMEFSFFSDGPALAAGLHMRKSFNRFCPIPPCFIADEAMPPALAAVTAWARASGLPVYDKRIHQGVFRHAVLRRGVRTGQMMVNIVTGRREGMNDQTFAPLAHVLPAGTALLWTINAGLSDAVNVDELRVISGQSVLEERVQVRGREFRFEISPFSFFQTNTLATERLYETVLDLLEPRPDDEVVDLYCGTGSIGMTVAPLVRRVTGVEQVVEAVASAERNRVLNGLENISFVADRAEGWVAGSQASCSALVIDPPRAGLSQKVVDYICAALPPRVVYVSCNPATLARDLKLLAAQGGYAARRIVPVDLFPQTYHIETVVSLTR